jgi:O-antigen/teichoic acid export membrane protein
MTGHERSAAVLLVCSAMVNAGANAVHIGMPRLCGGAIDIPVSLVVRNVVMAIFLWRRLNLLPGVLAIFRIPLPKERHVVAARGRVM